MTATSSSDEARTVGEGRWLWPSLALPGVLWLVVLFLTPLYAVLAVAMGTQDPIFGGALPVWNPLRWDPSVLGQVLRDVFTGQLGIVFLRTLVYVAAATFLSLLIGYPVAYYVARHAGRWRVLLLLLIIAPFWINYLMRMLAWVNLLSTDGYVNQVLMFTGILDAPREWLVGKHSTVILGLVYGYVPFLILPLFAALDRIDPRVIEAARDLGASSAQAFWRVTLPLSSQGVLAGCVIITLPMFGDYYTATLLSGSPRTTMVGKLIEQDINSGAAADRGAALTIVLMALVGLLMVYYLYSVARATKSGPVVSRLAKWWSDPWGGPWGLALFAWGYVLWSLAPVAVAVMFGFNDGRSRSAWQGFSLRWYIGDANLSVLNDPSLRAALIQSLKLASLTMLIATPLGVALAIGLARWRGRGARPANFLMLFPLITPEIVMGVSLFFVFVYLFGFVQFGTQAQLLGNVTFTVSYVVIVVRGRLFTVGREYEEAAMDLGASRWEAMRMVLLPMLSPAIWSSLMVAFAISIDDFVITAFLMGDQSSATIPVKLYSAARLAPSPALNALASILLFASMLAIVVALVVMRRSRKREGAGGSTVEDFARLDI